MTPSDCAVSRPCARQTAAHEEQSPPACSGNSSCCKSRRSRRVLSSSADRCAWPRRRDRLVMRTAARCSRSRTSRPVPERALQRRRAGWPATLHRQARSGPCPSPPAPPRSRPTMTANDVPTSWYSRPSSYPSSRAPRRRSPWVATRTPRSPSRGRQHGSRPSSRSPSRPGRSMAHQIASVHVMGDQVDLGQAGSRIERDRDDPRSPRTAGAGTAGRPRWRKILIPARQAAGRCGGAPARRSGCTVQISGSAA